MTDYRLFLKNAQGHILERIELDCPDDQTAIEHIRTLASPYRKDLWVETHRVCEIPPAIGPVVATRLDRLKKKRVAPEPPVA